MENVQNMMQLHGRTSLKYETAVMLVAMLMAMMLMSQKNEIEPQRALQHWQPAKNNQCSLPSKKTQKEDKNEGTLYSTV